MVKTKRKINKTAAAVAKERLPKGTRDIEPSMSGTRTKSPAVEIKAARSLSSENAPSKPPKEAHHTTFHQPTDQDQSQAATQSDPTDTSRNIPTKAHKPKQTHEEAASQAPQPQPASPAASFVSEDLEDIDLRSPSDDPDYDFIDKAEAIHSARNAQPDRANKYPELESGSAQKSEQAGGTKVAGDKGKVDAKKRRRGWFF